MEADGTININIGIVISSSSSSIEYMMRIGDWIGVVCDSDIRVNSAK